MADDERADNGVSDTADKASNEAVVSGQNGSSEVADTRDGSSERLDAID